jgi:hypothetical protein
VKTTQKIERLELGGSQTYYRLSDYAVVIAGATENKA